MSHAGLGGAEIGSLARRYLRDEPNVFSREGAGGGVFFVRGTSGARRGPARCFAIVSEGGALLRLAADDRERFLGTERVHENAALPEWVRAVALDVARTPEGDVAGPAPSADTVEAIQGAPDEWVWLVIEDEFGFNKRRPLIRNALDFARFLASRS